MSRRRDLIDDDLHREVEERHHRKHLARDAEAGDVLLGDEDDVSEQDQNGQSEPDCAKHDRRLSIRLDDGPVGAVADVGAVARVEACAPSRVHIDGCTGAAGAV